MYRIEMKADETQVRIELPDGREIEVQYLPEVPKGREVSAVAIVFRSDDFSGVHLDPHDDDDLQAVVIE